MKSPSKGKYFVIPFVIYAWKLVICMKCDDAEFKAINKKYLTDTNFKTWDDEENLAAALQDHQAAATVTWLDSLTMVIRLRTIPRTPKQFAELHHELRHAVDFSFYYIGLKLTLDSHEAYAYMTGYLTEQIYTNLKKL